MHHLRDSLLSPSPKDIPELTLPNEEEDIKESIYRGELEELRGTAFHNRTWIVSDRYCTVGDGVDSLEPYLHSLWCIYYHLARNTSHESTSHDRLVLDILRIQGKGALTRPVSGRYGIDIARTVEGTLWNDLPFLATDMSDYWVKNCAPMSAAHRANFASFLAKLASTRVSKDRMCQIALFTLRITFEEARELRTTDAEESEKEDPKRRINDLDLVHLLQTATIWIKEAGETLLQLSDVYWNDCPSDMSKGGQQFVESEFGKRSPTGFTPWRYMFWLKRIHEIRDEAKAAKEKRLQEYATDAIDFMTTMLEERNSEVLRVYQANADVLEQEKHLLCLKKIVDKDYAAEHEEKVEGEEEEAEEEEKNDEDDE